MIRQTLFIIALFFFSTILQAGDYHDRGSWKKSLSEKAVFFEKNIKERHNIKGTYPSSVRLTPPDYYAGSQEGAWEKIITTGTLPAGWYVDQGTTGLSNIAHTSSWTGCLLTGKAFHVAFLREKYSEGNPEFKEAYRRADEIISGIRKLTLISGQPGYLARGMAYGHGVSYGEREYYPWGEAGVRDLWQQGVGDLSHLRYRGGPSHHNYDQVFRGLGIYYFIAADDRQKQAIKEIVTDMSNWAHLKNDMVVMHVDGKRISTELIGGWRGMGGNTSPSGGSLMATTGLKISYLITGNEKVKKLYDKWVDVLGYRKFKDSEQSIMGQPRSNYDDTDHLLPDLYLLNLIEEDEELLAFYRKCVKDSWEAHKDDKMSWYNFIYRAVLGDEYRDTEGSLWNLHSFPTCRVLQPRMNSIRTDIEFYTKGRRKEALLPLPVYERPSDNEYEWKNSPYSLDDWLSRTVTMLQVSPHDPYVQYAVDENGWAYWSNTKGEIWHAVDGLTCLFVRDILFSTDYPWLVLAATNQGLFRTFDGGQTWSKSSDLAFEYLSIDSKNTHILYAVNNNGVYKSSDFGEREIGVQWQLISGEVPLAPVKKFAIDNRCEPSKIYLMTEQGLYTKLIGNFDWTAPERPARQRGFSSMSQAPVGEPLWIHIDETVENRLFRSVEVSGWRTSGTLITVSEDGGKTWSPVIRETAPLYDWAESRGNSRILNRDELNKLYGLLKKLAIQDLKIAPNDPNTWYGRLEEGVAVTHDAGQTWNVSNNGLDIPRVGAIFIPRHSDDVYAGTPAGMYVSYDQGNSWEDTSLILQEGGANRAEISGNGFLSAYWLGMYHGYITDEETNAVWWQK